VGKPDGNTGFTRLINATRFSWRGWSAALRHEAAFRQEMAATLVFIPLALWLGETSAEKALMIASWMLVPIVELLNSAMETAVDRISDEHHPLAGRAKDMGSAAVLTSLLTAGAVWALILFF
jgi:diacylglycerol kinase (ATP)